MSVLEALAIVGHFWAAHRWLRVGFTRAPRGSLGALTVLLAIASASAACFLGALVFDARPWPRVLVDALYVGCVARICRGRASAAAAPAEPFSPWVLLPVALGLLGAGIFWRQCQLDPYGLHDATAMWNHKARLLYLAPDHWLEVLRTWHFIPHADYPLLLSAWNARVFFVLGAPAIAVPAATQAVLLVCCAVLAWTLLRTLTGPAAAGVGAAAVLALPELAYWSAGQMADCPLAIYLLAATGTLMLGLARAERGWLLIAGLCAGWAGWVKNEGLIHAVCLVAAGLVCAWRRRGSGLGGVATLAWFGAGLVVPCLVIALYKQAVPVGNDMLNAHRTDEILRLLTDPSRYALVGGHLLWIVWRSGGGIWFAFLALVVVRRVLLGAPDLDPRVWRWPALALLGMYLAVLLAYVATVHSDPVRHMDFSADRLVLQLWPATVLVASVWSSGARARNAAGAPRDAARADAGAGLAVPVAG